MATPESHQGSGRKLSNMANIRSRLKLDTTTMLRMLKGGLPPLIVTAMYQSNSISNIEDTFGYIAAILTVSAQCLLPRAKFTKILFFSVLASCVAAALCCIAVVCCVQARQHSTSPDATPSEREGYNSSDSVVSAIWLLLGVWLANAFRSYRPPELQDPMVAASIFMVVTLTSTPSMLTISEGLNFVRRLLITFFIGLTIAAGVSIPILPITSRRNIFQALEAYTNTMDKLFDAQIAFVRHEVKTQSLVADEKIDPNSATTSPSQISSDKDRIASASNALRGLLSQMDADLVYTGIEVAWGKLLPADLVQIRYHMGLLFLPLAGLAMLPEIHQNILSSQSMQQTSEAADHNATPVAEDAMQEPSWNGLTNGLAKRLTSTRELAVMGLSTAFELLEIHQSGTSRLSKRRTQLDLERQNTESSNTSELFRRQLTAYSERRHKLHEIWPSLMFPSYAEAQSSKARGEFANDHDVREHLLVHLSMEHLQNEVLEAVHGLLSFAENKVSSGSMKRNSLIFPLHQSSMLTDLSWLKPHDHKNENDSSSPAVESWVDMDAEHLPPSNWFERSSHRLRIIPSLLTSPESVFGARVALATVTVSILAYIRQTQEWFNQERVIWAMVVIVIGMKAESGASTFGYLARIGGTTVSLILSLIVWYIVDGHAAGVLVFLYLANVFEYYFWVRYPQHLGPCTIAIVTLNVIIYYELQVKKLGIERATANGQPYLPVYLFGPYKLLTVIAGVTISFFWTIFPSPASARTQVRKSFGQGLLLLANFYSCMHHSVRLWIDEQQGDSDDSASPGQQLYALNRSLYHKQTALLVRTQSLVHWTSYEIPLGGKFPQSLYLSAASNVQMLATCMALVTHATKGINLSGIDSTHTSNPNQDSTILASKHDNPSVPERWIHQLARATESSNFDTHVIASILCQLAGALANNSALPPYLSAPESFALVKRLREVNTQAMRMENIRDAEFSAFACMEVCASLINQRLTELIGNVKDLVGEISFDVGVKDEKREREKVL